MSLIDSYGRRINYLRLSVTDRCNLRCRYCMPAKGMQMLPHHEILSFEELLRVSEQAVAAGICKIRVTGGEPLVRRGILPFLARLGRLPGLKELVLTTNGVLLGEMARGLKDAGVQRLNISLDSLKPETFARITRGGKLSDALSGIEAAEKAGFPPHKINVVLMRGVNDDEIMDFVELTRERPYNVRFIEYMPTHSGNWRAFSIPGAEVLERIAERYLIEKLEPGEHSGPATNFRVRGAPGSLGIISAMTGHFCGSCNRLRVTAAGLARGCLFSGEGVDLRPLLAAGDDSLLREEIRRIVQAKPAGHEMRGRPAIPPASFHMSGIGG
ncbi:GTP 3',8-cyclase MoaA [Geomonas subterranea]|uniref:GTP 3',8-cyclase MoaA n=1 Tax=Geomonas subterranea TaxID=2847989 RepID=UPI001CD1A9D1|nr:GTP 3',8-cyclase MoaA [Geomonas fuzhouensis]